MKLSATVINEISARVSIYSKTLQLFTYLINSGYTTVLTRGKPILYLRKEKKNKTLYLRLPHRTHEHLLCGVMRGDSKGRFCCVARIFFLILVELVAEEGTKVMIVCVSN